MRKRNPNPQYYNPITQQLEDEYPDGMTAQQYYTRKYLYQPQTLGDALTFIRNLRAENRRLRKRIDALRSAKNNGHMPAE
jgi:hypothetical protein